MPSRAIVLLLDQLSRRCLGCYGHEWIDTPNLDRLASRSVVFDHCFSSPADVDDFRNSAACLRERLQNEASTVVDVLRLDQLTSPDEGASDVHSAFHRLLDEAAARLEQWRADESSPRLMWLELPGIGWPGVADSQFVELYAEELTDDLPDELREFREVEVAYGALLSQFDGWLGRLLDRVKTECGESQPLFVMAAAHGEPLGELDRLAHFDERGGEKSIHVSPLRDESVHVPLLIAGATNHPLGHRRLELVTLKDLLPTLAAWFRLNPASEWPVSGLPEDSLSLCPLMQNKPCRWRDELHLRDTSGTVALRNQECLFVQIRSHDSDGPSAVDMETEASHALYLKPEDLWDVNNVADQFPELVEHLRERLNAHLAAHRSATGRSP
jgi:arylsulfatase A-like enzyme